MNCVFQNHLFKTSQKYAAEHIHRTLLFKTPKNDKQSNKS